MLCVGLQRYWLHVVRGVATLLVAWNAHERSTIHRFTTRRWRWCPPAAGAVLGCNMLSAAVAARCRGLQHVVRMLHGAHPPEWNIIGGKASAETPCEMDAHALKTTAL